MPRPGGGRPPRERRPGRAGKSPKPVYKPSKTGGGTKHKPGSPTRNGDMCRVGKLIGATILAFIAASVLGIAGAAVFS
jgi:hypothetical protein